MQTVIDFLASQNFDQLPPQLCKGKITSPYRCRISFIHPDTNLLHSLDLGDPNSCTATAVGIIHCIGTGFENLIDLSCIQKLYEQSLDDLPSTRNEIQIQENTFYFFHTPGHRFILLCMKDDYESEIKGIILHSNMDSYTKGRNYGQVFSLRTYLESNRMIRFSTIAQILQFFHNLIYARDDKDQCESIFEHHFGYKFTWASPFAPFTGEKRSSGEWWFCKMSLSSNLCQIPPRVYVDEHR